MYNERDSLASRDQSRQVKSAYSKPHRQWLLSSIVL